MVEGQLLTFMVFRIRTFKKLLKSNIHWTRRIAILYHCCQMKSLRANTIKTFLVRVYIHNLANVGLIQNWLRYSFNN